MSRKVKQKISSVPFSLNKLYRKISTAKPSTLMLAIAAMGIAVFLFGGGLYDLIMRPFPAIYYNSQIYLVDPRGLSEQFIADSVIAMTLFSLGMGGLVIIYQSTKNAYKPRQAYMMLMMGFILLFMAYMLLEIMIQIKSGG
ncbi:hypothetical protein MUO74_02020 [Candidatus Bathyarchaeota archaeon]|nr:hypothetical protein [Candidatus Bathyarchaeota archaeon]